MQCEGTSFYPMNIGKLHFSLACTFCIAHLAVLLIFFLATRKAFSLEHLWGAGCCTHTNQLAQLFWASLLFPHIYRQEKVSIGNALTWWVSNLYPNSATLVLNTEESTVSLCNTFFIMGNFDRSINCVRIPSRCALNCDLQISRGEMCCLSEFESSLCTLWRCPPHQFSELPNQLHHLQPLPSYCSQETSAN